MDKYMYLTNEEFLRLNHRDDAVWVQALITRFGLVDHVDPEVIEEMEEEIKEKAETIETNERQIEELEENVKCLEDEVEALENKVRTLEWNAANFATSATTV